MRRFGLWLLLPLLIAGLALLAGRLNRASLDPTSVLPDRMAWMAKASASATFVLDPSHRLEYSVPNSQGQLRLLINANLNPELLTEGLSEGSPKRARAFRVEIEELGAWGHPIRRQDWRFLAKVQTFRDPEQGTLRTLLFYPTRPWIPSGTCEVKVDIPPARRLRTLRLRLVEADPEIHDLVVRAYTSSLASLGHQDRGWEHLDERFRAQLISGNVYPEGLLRDQEKRNLLELQWQPLAPNSSWRQRPLERVVYRALTPMNPEVGTAYEPQGLRVDATRLAVFHLPMAGGGLRLEARAWDGPSAGSAAGPQQLRSFLKLHWVGLGLGNRKSQSHPWPGQTLMVEGAYQGGYLIAEANRPGYLRAWMKAPQGEVEITPPPASLGTALLGPGQEVSYSVPPAGSDPLALRLEVRQILRNPDLGTLKPWLDRDQISARWPLLSSRGSAVSLEILDGQDRTIHRASLPQDSGLSPLEDLPKSFQPARLSLPVSTALLLPPAARRVRIAVALDPLNPPVLVAAYNRPQSLPGVRVVPDDFYRFDTRETRFPEWYGLDPERLDRLIRDKRWIPVRTQSLPDAEEEGILSGAYELDPLEPQGGTFAREVLLPRKSWGLPPRVDGLNAYYREVRPGTASPVRLQARTGLQALRPTLLRIGAPQAAPFALEWDGKAAQQMPPPLAIQETLLPPQAPGSHRLRILGGGPGRFFLNHQWPGPEDWTKRLAYPCEPGRTLSFLHTRITSLPETLTLGFFTHARSAGDVTLHLRIVGPDPVCSRLQPTLTRMARLFRARALPSKAGFLLHGEGAALWAAPLASLSLGPDLPPGSYRVECRIESGPAGYLILSRSQAGVRPKAQVDQEPLLGASP